MTELFESLPEPDKVSEAISHNRKERDFLKKLFRLSIEAKAMRTDEASVYSTPNSDAQQADCSLHAAPCDYPRMCKK